jgi:hypothetical protein
MKKEYDDLRLIYQINIDDIRAAKRQEWAIAYNVLLVHAALFGLYNIFQSKLVESFCPSQAPIAYIGILTIALLANCFGIYLFADITHNLVLYRYRFLAVKKDLGKKANAVLGISKEVEEGGGMEYPRWSRYFYGIVCTFIFFHLMGLIFLTYFLLADSKWRKEFYLLIFGLWTACLFICLLRSWRKSEDYKDQFKKRFT